MSRTAVRASGPNVCRSTDTNRTNRSDQRKRDKHKTQLSEESKGFIVIATTESKVGEMELHVSGHEL